MDIARIGEEFVKLALISRQLGHHSLRMTAEYYLLPHHGKLREFSPEALFVLRLAAGGDPQDLVPLEAMLAFVTEAGLPPVPA
jgi:hypothetical protein